LVGGEYGSGGLWSHSTWVGLRSPGHGGTADAAGRD